MATLKGGLVARRGRPGEQVLALNGKSYAVDESMTVIADDEAVHDIGGIMGGEHSGATEATTDVLIECAYFTPERIAVTGQKRSEEHTSELQSLMRISYAVFGLKKKKKKHVQI